jgi:glycosyltransferase involved in cell wall biosynthesis
MRILFVYDHLEVGGTQTYGLGLSRHLIRAGHTVGVAARGGATLSLFERLGVCCFAWPAPTRLNPIRQMKAMRIARDLLRNWQPDVIHAHAVLPGLLFAAVARDPRNRTPVIFGPQRSWRSLYRFPGSAVLNWAMYRLLRAGADEVIAVSDGLRREFVQHGISPAKCHLIPNGVDLSLFDGGEPIYPDGPARVVGIVGRLVEQKGIDVFIDAAAQVAPITPDVEFWIVGDGPLREDCQRRIAAHGLEDRVVLLGERADVPGLLGQMSVFVSASRWEGLPYALLEALAAKRPVVATRVLGSSELIADGIHGLLVPPDDPAPMSRAILRLLNDPDQARTLAGAGRALVETQYSLPIMAERVMAVYRRALERRDGAA